MEDDLNLRQMEDYLNILANGRRPQYFDKWKTTSNFGKMKPQSLVNLRQTKYYVKWNTTSIFWLMEDYFNFFQSRI